MTASVFLVIVLAGTAWWGGMQRPTAMAFQEPPYAPLSTFEHDAIRNLLADVAMDRTALVALNPTASQAESVLSTVRSWWFDNQATLSSLKATIVNERATVRQLRRDIAMGTAQPGAQDTLRLAIADLATARQAYRDGLGPVETSVNALLSSSQQPTWSAIKTGWGQDMPIRMLSLSGQQRIDLSRAKRRYQYSHAAASSDAERSTAVSTWQADLDQILTTAQESVLDAYDGYYPTASTAVATAIDTVLEVDAG